MQVTLTDLCDELNNWFDTDSNGEKDRVFSEFTITDGMLDLSDTDIQTGQYFRIIGSVFNDGVHQYPDSELIDETFDGAIWIMRVPPQILGLLEEINDWNDKYAPIIDSPFNSESFGGYSYSKGYRSSITSGWSTWRTKFEKQINKWRKTRNTI